MVTPSPYIADATKNRAQLDLRVGDTVRVQVKIVEKGKTRLQSFDGLVLARKHGTEPGATFTVRKISHGIGVERVFPLYSPSIDSIEVLKRSRVRRSKLYYIRDKVARDIRRKMRNFVQFLGGKPSTNDIVDNLTVPVSAEPETVSVE